MKLDPQKRLIVFSVMLATFLTAIDGTIVETAIPRIVGQLGGFSLYTWLVTGYLLTSTVTIPIYGKLADMIGRKRAFTIGAIIFLLGSALCGIATTMPQLVIFRGLQGLGAGGILPVVQTIIGDIFAPAERARMQGWFSSVWGLSGLIGPLVGGAIVDHVSWRYIFYINVPLGILALYMLLTNLQETVERRTGAVDYLGCFFLTGGLATLMLALVTGGIDFPWDSPVILGLFGAAVLLLALFFWQERRHPDPMLPLDIFREPTIGIANLASIVIGGVMYGTTVYLPLWAQGVQGFSATRSGASLLWLTIGWPLASMLGGRYIMKVGQRPAALLGLALNVVGAAGLVVLARVETTIPEYGLALVTFIIGCGMGFSALAFILGVQSSVGYERRGVATASLQFIRTMGGLCWIAVMGAVMNASFATHLQGIEGLNVQTAGQAATFANQLLDPIESAKLSAVVLTAARGALAAALRNVHLVVLLCAVLSLVFTFWLPHRRFEQGVKPTGAASH